MPTQSLFLCREFFFSFVLSHDVDFSQKRDHDDFVFKKRRFLVQDTRKVDCAAQIEMREILAFPEYKVGPV